MPDIRAEYRIVNRCLLAFLLAALVVPWTVNVPEIPETRAAWRWRPPGSACLELTGKPCSSTGLTRSVVALYYGHWERSLEFNPAGWVYVIFLLVQVFLRVFPERMNRIGIPWMDVAQIVCFGIVFHWLLNELALPDEIDRRFHREARHCFNWDSVQVRGWKLRFAGSFLQIRSHFGRGWPIG